MPTAAEAIRVMQSSRKRLTAGEIHAAGSFTVGVASVYVELRKMTQPGGRGILTRVFVDGAYRYELRAGADVDEYLLRRSVARNHGARRRAA